MAWDDSKLNELKAKYGEAHGGEMFDPTFRKVADKIFSKNGTRLAPYSGVPTFLMAPHMPVDANEPDFGNLQVAIIGVPMDLGVTNRPGSRFGPRAMRTMLVRLVLFYVLSLAIMLAVVPWTETGAKEVAQSPFVKGLPNRACLQWSRARRRRPASQPPLTRQRRLSCAT